ncbi:hypothetical protein [Streptomyces sp. NPDC056105]|uniref:hypothetical protein n=1 Tax=Streptomyces sp. NPDC056105 TaxID=3345714 RepID=UPI0035DEA933
MALTGTRYWSISDCRLAPSTGVLRDCSGLDSDDKTSLNAMQEVMALDGGPAWTADVTWSDAAHSGFSPPVRVRPMIGSQAAAPEAVFDLPGCVSTYTLTESYEQGKGTTVATARGKDEGDDTRLSSRPRVATALDAGGRPRHIYRCTPASGITDPSQLTAHAVTSLAAIQTGAAVWDVEAIASGGATARSGWGRRRSGPPVRRGLARSLRRR